MRFYNQQESTLNPLLHLLVLALVSAGFLLNAFATMGRTWSQTTWSQLSWVELVSAMLQETYAPRDPYLFSSHTMPRRKGLACSYIQPILSSRPASLMKKMRTLEMECRPSLSLEMRRYSFVDIVIALQRRLPNIRRKITGTWRANRHWPDLKIIEFRCM